MKRVRYILAAIVLSLVPSMALADDGVVSIVRNINESGNICIYQPEALTRLLERPANAIGDGDSTEAVDAQRSVTASRAGYRVQVFDDNNPHSARRQAEAANAQVHGLFPQYRSYLTFNSPYWCVKVGDFRTRGEAEAALAEIRAVLPGYSAYLRVVRDRINPRD
ncbi:MAG: SPOR domain-containing protein [Muribaculaceae bacterium]|nr:SPOR domain-containing protein [Muribaculaceae bacterium]